LTIGQAATVPGFQSEKAHGGHAFFHAVFQQMPIPAVFKLFFYRRARKKPEIMKE